jgi:NAD(P)-dependent dehydrogenase (short-subunit alcohol dehydrogenase family)
MRNALEGKVAIITGASSGIGKATARACGKAGTKVVLAARRVEEGEAVAREIRDEGGDALFVRTDVTKAADVEAMVAAAIRTYGRLDCAFNNAGNIGQAPLIDFTEEQWDTFMHVHLKGTWLCLKHEIRAMLKRGGGSIVNMASACAEIATEGDSAYGAAKAGIVSLTRYAALEHAESGIRVNAVSPALIRSEMVDGFPPEVKAELMRKYSAGRMGEPSEIADAVLWLFSQASSFVTGHNLVIDGGYTPFRDNTRR